MSEYTDKFKPINRIKFDFTKKYGAGKLDIAPQDGPQKSFISCMSGMSGGEPDYQDFPLIFYGGAK